MRNAGRRITRAMIIEHVWNLPFRHLQQRNRRLRQLFHFTGRPKRVGHLALAIQVAFQELGVFPASNTAVPLEAKDAMPFSTVQAVETSQRVAAMGQIVMASTGSFSGTAENGATPPIILSRPTTRRKGEPRTAE
jgi:hypothetical protein